MTQPPTNSDSPPTRPAGDQFTLRGMFLLMTVVCVILAVLALSVRTPLHWLGLGLIPVFCLIVIGCIELVYQFAPRSPRYVAYRSPFANPGESPFMPTSPGGSPFAPSAEVKEAEEPPSFNP